MTFDPTKHLMTIGGKDYLEVRFRVEWFRDRYPNGSIVTRSEHLSGDTAIFRAEVYLPEEMTDPADPRHILATARPIATGYGSETKGDWKDFVEKAETKAIGRALAAAGFGTQFCDDLVFDPDGKGRVVDSPTALRPPVFVPPAPVGHRPAPTPNASTPDLATDKQLRACYAIAVNQVGLTKDGYRAWVGNQDLITRREASALIEYLNTLPAGSPVGDFGAIVGRSADPWGAPDGLPF